MTGAASPGQATPVTLNERIQISNGVDAQCIEAAERFHRRSSLLRRSRFGLEITPYQEHAVHAQTHGRQTRLAEHLVDAIDLACHADPGLRRKKSVRSFARGPALHYRLLMDILYLSFCADTDAEQPRPYASAGGCYPVHAVLLPLVPVEGAPFDADSILHVAAQERALYALSGHGALNAAVTCLDGMPGQEADTFANAAFVIVYVIDLEVATLRYAERGYRFALIETGLMAQQATLVTEQRGLRSCMFGGFPDAELCAALGLNPKKMLVCMTQIFGYL